MSLSIPGVPTLPGGLERLTSPPRTARGIETAVPRPDLRAEGHASPEPATAATTAPSEVPPGTDPELWAVLTTEERAHFSRLRAMGPLTYTTDPAAGSPSASQARRGVRLDVRA